MKLNCRKGDLAVVVKAFFPDEKKYIGMIFRCGEFIERPAGPCWYSDPPFTGELADKVVLDRFLKPLRDSDGTDETLSWIDVPNEVTA